MYHRLPASLLANHLWWIFIHSALKPSRYSNYMRQEPQKISFPLVQSSLDKLAHYFTYLWKLSSSENLPALGSPKFLGNFIPTPLCLHSHLCTEINHLSLQPFVWLFCSNHKGRWWDLPHVRCPDMSFMAGHKPLANICLPLLHKYTLLATGIELKKVNCTEEGHWKGK